MVSSLESGHSHLKTISLVNSRMIPVEEEDGGVSAPGTVHLYNFFIPADSPTCPHASIRNRPDGHVTGDLFEEVHPGCFAFRTF